MRNFVALFLLSSSLHAATYAPKNYERLLTMPGFTPSALSLHVKLYEGYVKNTNDLLIKLEALQGSTSYEYGALKRRLGWEFDGMRLHELYFDQLGGKGVPDQQSALYTALSKQFGSFEAWKKDFVATGLMRGIGWVVLSFDAQQARYVNTWINEHDTGYLVTVHPILIMDVFEHAYMLQFGLDRAAYIQAFFANLDWKVPESRIHEITAPGASQK